MKKIKNSFSYYFIEPIQDFKAGNNNSLSDSNSSIYRFLFATTFILLLFLMPIASQDFGRSTDETFSESYGRDILAYYESGGKDKAVFDLSNPSYKDLIYYGLSFDFFCAIVNKYISPFGDFETRHFLNALIGLLGMLIASLLGKKYGGWRTAWLVLIFMAITSRYFAHSMNNSKDIPLATAYIAGVFFTLKFLEELPKPKWKTILLLLASIGLASSVRIGGMILFAYLGLFVFIKWIVIYFREKSKALDKKLIGSYILYLGIIGIGAYILAIIFWPYALQDPLKIPLKALRMFEDSDLMMTHYEVFEGKLLNMDQVPWYYIFKYLWISLPLIVIIGALSSLKGLWKEDRRQKIVILILAFVTIFPILYAASKGSKLYNGWRHFLFIYPSLAVMAALGWNYMFIQIRTKVLGIIIAIFALVLIVKPAIWMIKNHPNQLVYFNEIVGGINGAYGYYETDYLSFSGKEAAEWLAKKEQDNPNSILVATNIETQSLKYYSDKYKSNIDYVWVRPMAHGIHDWDYMILTSRSMSLSRIQNKHFPPKGTIHTIMVDNVPICAIVKKENDFKFRGYQSFIQTQYDSSKYYLEKAATYNPNDPEVLTMLGTTLAGLEEYDTAQKILMRAIEIFPENFYAFDKLGILYMRQDKNKKALDALRKSIYLRKNYSIAYVNLAGAFQNLQQYDSALYYYEIASRRISDDINMELNIAECLIAIKQYQQAHVVYDKILRKNPNNQLTIAKKENLNSFIQSQRMLDKMSNDIQYELEKAEKFMSTNQYDSVLAIFSKILEKDPNNILALVNRGVANLNLGNFNKALIDLEKAETIDTSSHYLFYNLGLAYANTNQFYKALTCYNKANKLSPSDIGVLNERAKLHLYLQKYEESLSDCNTILKIQPNLKETLYSRAWLYNKLNKKDLALIDLNNIIQNNPGYAIAYDLRSILYYEQKEYKKALLDVEKALSLGYKIDPKYAEYLRSVTN